MGDHQHHHHPPGTGRTLVWSFALTAGFAVIEGVGGWWAGSLALFGDAGHMISDATALGFAALAAWVAKHPPSSRHSYGLGRAEVVAAVVNSLLMVAVVVAIAIAAVSRLRQPIPVAGGAVMGVALAGLIINIGVAWILSRSEHTLNTRAALIHVMGDLLGSLAALTAGAVIYFTGWTPIDPILSLFICALILYSALRLLREALHVIMEGVPLDLDLREVGQAMAATAGVISVHDLHIWTLSSGKAILSAHVIVSDMGNWEDTLSALRQLIHECFDIEHVTLQPERQGHGSVVHVPLVHLSRH
ncbi:MAG: cation diffusion facilitator family transporter [Gammaproteobacteria bacterium]